VKGGRDGVGLPTGYRSRVGDTCMKGPKLVALMASSASNLINGGRRLIEVVPISITVNVV
jgi:hypothetical protein